VCHETGTHNEMCFFNCIHQVSPQSSLLEGGTSVTISGTNLGSSVGQVGDISIAGVTCRLTDYVVSFTLVDTTLISMTSTDVGVAYIDQGSKPQETSRV